MRQHLTLSSAPFGPQGRLLCYKASQDIRRSEISRSHTTVSPAGERDGIDYFSRERQFREMADRGEFSNGHYGQPADVGRLCQ
jgi:guanylate kinase